MSSEQRTSWKSRRNPAPPAPGARQTFRKVGHIDQANADAINVTLFRNAEREPCGWFIGPLSFYGGRFTVPFLPKSEETMASLAVVRALAAAKVSGHPLCLVDPEDLWDTVWRS